MVALNLLRVDFPDSMSRRREMASRDSCRSGIKVHQPTRLEQLRQLPKDLSGPIP